MISKQPPFRIRFIVIVVFLSLATVAGQAAIEGLFSYESGTKYTYSYTINNTDGAFDISAFALEFNLIPDWNQDDTGIGGDVTVAPGWIAQAGFPTLGSSAQDMLSFSSLSDVLVGDTLGGFSFASSYAPGNVTCYEFSAFGDSSFGSVVGPVVPEASTVWAGILPTGLLGYHFLRAGLCTWAQASVNDKL